MALGLHGGKSRNAEEARRLELLGARSPRGPTSILPSVCCARSRSSRPSDSSGQSPTKTKRAAGALSDHDLGRLERLQDALSGAQVSEEEARLAARPAARSGRGRGCRWAPPRPCSAGTMPATAGRSDSPSTAIESRRSKARRSQARTAPAGVGRRPPSSLPRRWATTFHPRADAMRMKKVSRVSPGSPCEIGR